MAHPFVEAWQHRDADAWREALAPDVVVHSPLLRTPFEGRDAAAEVYRTLFAQFGEVRIAEELGDGDTTAFHWFGVSGGQTIEGADLVRLDADGRVAEIRVLMRPLVAIGSFTASMAPAVARPRGRIAAFLARLSVAPIGPLFRLIDAAATRMSRQRL